MFLALVEHCEKRFPAQIVLRVWVNTGIPLLFIEDPGRRHREHSGSGQSRE